MTSQGLNLVQRQSAMKRNDDVHYYLLPVYSL